MDLHAVGGREDHRFRIHQVLQREVRREGVRGERPRVLPRVRTVELDHRLEGAASVAPEVGDSALDGHRQGFDPAARGQGLGGRSPR